MQYSFGVSESLKKAIENNRKLLPMMNSDDNNINDIEIIDDIDIGYFNSYGYQKINPYDIPPSVFSLYISRMNELDSIYGDSPFYLSKKEKEKLMDMMPIVLGKISLGTGFSPGISISTDFNHIFSMALSPVYRRRYLNSKHATAYKSYYNSGNFRPAGFTEYEKKQIRQSMINIKNHIR